MTEISIEEIKQNPNSFLQRVESGESLLIVRTGTPIAELKPVSVSNENRRPYGLCAGEFTVPDDFDAPLPEDILKLFEGR